ncbi:hypothetical protein PUN28_015501 [Cardiocondyla obscurior]|uniref:Uncharacterized protein n=1 Tax=Cardiocondyla obscurior TaxID=286306 RepID=A0AAW2EWZ0_9HYME
MERKRPRRGSSRDLRGQSEYRAARARPPNVRGKAINNPARAETPRARCNKKRSRTELAGGQREQRRERQKRQRAEERRRYIVGTMQGTETEPMRMHSLCDTHRSIIR